MCSESNCVVLLASTLHGSMESELVDNLDELIDGHARGIECHPRLLVAKAHVGSVHPREPFQGSLDRHRSGLMKFGIESASLAWLLNSSHTVARHVFYGSQSGPRPEAVAAVGGRSSDGSELHYDRTLGY